MCGIIAILRRRSTRPVPSAGEITQLVNDAARLLRADADTAALRAAHASLANANRLLQGTPGVMLLVADRAFHHHLGDELDQLSSVIATIEGALESPGMTLGTAALEARSSALIAVKDALWALRRDRLRTAGEVAALAGPNAGPAALVGYLAIQEALSAIDRLEVRGRDSAGLHILVAHHGLDGATGGTGGTGGLVAARGNDPTFGDTSVRVVDGCLSFIYKAAAEIGELGDNVAAMRASIANDELLRAALAGPDAEVAVLGHTRWASVGIISGPNAHPLNSEEVDVSPGPYAVAALNGDVDNFADLKASYGLRIRPEITTDAKVIPTLTSRAMAEGLPAVEAFRRSVAQMEGSVAIGAQAAASPGELLFALRGSGQALYIGLGEDVFIVASEPYGLVEIADSYLRLDGETPSDPANPTGSRGQIVAIRRDGAGSMEGIARISYDGSVLDLDLAELATPQITTRDIDRGAFPHFLLKEISESPHSFRKTLRGKLVADPDGHLTVSLGDEAIPPAVRKALEDGTVTRVAVIGQGTAAVAGQALVMALEAIQPDGPLAVRCLPATELSGFALRSDMSDTLVVAISQSGTTTDTNRTVDLVRGRGAQVIAIVNRRNSDLVDKADGVLYTSDGRDVEMSVASTKAFYSQIAAGFLLASAIADIVAPAGARNAAAARQDLLAALSALPGHMESVLDLRVMIAEAARQFAPSRRYWALVGNGPNRIAAAEIRIKLSELCYKSIACDVTEDKKHIDLSSEPMILVCAAGLSGSTADDVAKEIGIYRAHRAAPVVIASEGAERYPAALAILRVPDTHPLLAFVLSAMVGHLFGYEAALAIDALAVPLREARAAIESAISRGGGPEQLAGLAAAFEIPAARYFDALRAGTYDGHLEAATAARLASLFRYATGVVPLGSFQLEWGKVGTPAVVIDDLTRALTQGIDELTRPIDAIKHQAKTVTVGISRSDESLMETTLVKAVLGAGAARDRLSYDTLRTLAALSPTVAEVTGFTRYRLEGTGRDGETSITVVDRGGIALDLPLRTERNPRLRGTKHLVASEQQVMVAQGRSDGRMIVIVPEVKDGQSSGITLLHVRFVDRLPVATLRTALAGYRHRYRVLEDAVTETEPTFREDLLETVPVGVLFTEPIATLADRWRVAS